MTTTKQLVSGLGGAIGSDFISSQNRLVFTEFNGKISRYDMVRSLDHIVYSGIAVMPADSSLNLMDGTSAMGGQIRWDHTSPAGTRVMRPQGTCKLAYLGQVNYNAVGYADLQQLAYSQDSLDGAPGPVNQLDANAVFAVYNWDPSPVDLFDYVKVQVVSYGADIEVRWRAYRLRPAYQVLGTGYNQPEDVKVSADGQHAYVTERTGALLRIDLSNAHRVHAQVVSAGMAAPHQIVLAEDRGHAYLVEYANPGRLLRVDLASGAQSVMADNLQFAIGLAMSDDLRFAYITEQALAGGRLIRIDLVSGVRATLLTGLTNPFMLTWADAGQGALITTQRDPANLVSLIDLTQSPLAAVTLATVPMRPSSVAVVTPDRLIACCNDVLDEVDLTGSVFVATGPIIMGIGHVPADRIVGGYADTTVDPAYPFQVKDAPFGGSLWLMINRDKGYADGSRWYRVLVDGVVQTQDWSDYRWSTSTTPPQWVLQTASRVGAFYRVRPPHELWYNYWLGYRLNTSGLSNGLHTIAVELYSAANLAALMNTHTLQVMIDNSVPTARIDAILHDGAPVGTCAVVESGSNTFYFLITAYDPQGHLKSWSLSALWGDNASAGIASASYPGASPEPLPMWHGPLTEVMPAAPGWAAVRRCAHTFYLGIWDRVIDGYNHLHYADYHKSITIMLPGLP